MTKLINVIFGIVLALIGSSAFADSWCTDPNTGRPYHEKSARPCPPTASGVVGGGNIHQQQQLQYQQQRVYNLQHAPQGMVVGQPMIMNVGGVQQRCTLLDRGVSGLAQGGLAGAIGYISEKVLNRDNHKLSAGAFVGGLVAGATITCDPTMVNDDVQQVQHVARQQASQHRPDPHVYPVSAEEQVGGVVATPQNGTKVEEQSLPSGGQQDTCRLRIKGKPVAEIKLPLSVKKEEAKAICDEWQQREAKSRGLV